MVLVFNGYRVSVWAVSPSTSHEVMGPDAMIFVFRSHYFMANRWGNNGKSERLYFWGLQNHYIKIGKRASLVIHWKESACQCRKQAQSRIREDPTCHRAAKSPRHDPEPGNPQYWSPRPSLRSASGAAAMRSPHGTARVALLAATRGKPSTAKTNG